MGTPTSTSTCSRNITRANQIQASLKGSDMWSRKTRWRTMMYRRQRLDKTRSLLSTGAVGFTQLPASCTLHLAPTTDHGYHDYCDNLITPNCKQIVSEWLIWTALLPRCSGHNGKVGEKVNTPRVYAEWRRREKGPRGVDARHDLPS